MQGQTIPRLTPVADAFFKGLARRQAAGGASPSHTVPLAQANQMDRPQAPRLPHPVGGGRPRIVFLVMSAVAPVQTVDQLARALAPHRVLVHHDFLQTPHFPLKADNVCFVPRPVHTGWARFGFVQGIFHGLQHAIDALDFDYLQLLSPSCLPIKPLAEFERHVGGMQEAHFDGLDLLADAEVRRNVGYRAWTAEGSLMHRAIRRLCRLHYEGAQGRRDEAGIWLRSQSVPGLQSRLTGLALDALAHPALARHLRAQPLRLYYGSVWFGARRHIVASMLRTWQQPGVQAYFSRVHIAEEFLVPSLLMKTHAHKGPLNHLIQRFDEAHPGLFGLEDLAELQASPAFFARKFPVDALAPVRLRVLQDLAHCGPPPQASAQPLAASA